MPKVTGAPALRRNQACRQCRKRKLKCDASRPHCGTCVKQWNAQISVPPPVGFTHPKEPSCTYDPVDGLQLAPEFADDPTERVRTLESQIAELQQKLAHAQQQSSRSASPNHPPSLGASPSSSFGNLSPPLHDRRAASADVKPYIPQEIILPQVSLNISQTPSTNYRAGIDVSPIEMQGSSASSGSYELAYSGWNQDLPDPTQLHHLVDAFFRCDPCGPRIIHRPSFMASLALPPTHPDFPHPALLHAICASASRWISQDVTGQTHKRRDRFAEFHAAKTRTYIDMTMVTGAQIFATLQACIILSWWFYAEGRWVEVWIFAGFQTRACVPLGLNHPRTHPTNSHGVYLDAPRTARDLETRRRVLWMSILFDRLVSVGGWPHGIDEQDIGTELPLRQYEFDNEINLPDNPQTLFEQSVLTIHHPLYTDSFLLLIKACMLFGRVTDYNTRTHLQTAVLNAPQVDRRTESAFQALDTLVTEAFAASFPPEFKSFLGPDGGVDSDLFLAHIVPHAATITLHVPYLSTPNAQPTGPSIQRCIQASRAILDMYYLLTSTSFDITRLHPFVVTVWHLAAIVQVHVCKHFITMGDAASEQAVWGEINVMRFALLQYGASSPIGVRQEKMLRDAMAEILRMTTQTAPLSLSGSTVAPVYPFSNATLWQRDAEESIVPIPLPSAVPSDDVTETMFANELTVPAPSHPWPQHSPPLSQDPMASVGYTRHARSASSGMQLPGSIFG